MQGSAMIFFALFCIVILGMYIVIRRHLARPDLTAAVGLLASIIAMVLTLMENDPDVSNAQAIFFGAVIGSLFSGAALAVAWYFQTGEMREQYMQNVDESSDGG